MEYAILGDWSETLSCFPPSSLSVSILVSDPGTMDSDLYIVLPKSSRSIMGRKLTGRAQHMVASAQPTAAKPALPAGAHNHCLQPWLLLRCLTPTPSPTPAASLSIANADLLMSRGIFRIQLWDCLFLVPLPEEK